MYSKDVARNWHRKEKEMKKVYFDGITEMGCVIKNAMVVVSEDYTMNQMVKAIKENGYKMFKLDSMKRFVEVR